MPHSEESISVRRRSMCWIVSGLMVASVAASYGAATGVQQQSASCSGDFKMAIHCEAMGTSVTISARKRLSGDVAAEALLANDAYYRRAAQKVSLPAEVVTELKNVAKQIQIVAFFGTWSVQSRQVIPQVIGLVQSAKNPNLTLKLTAVESDERVMNGAVARNRIKAYPTLLFMVDGREVFRTEYGSGLDSAPDVLGPVASSLLKVSR